MLVLSRQSDGETYDGIPTSTPSERKNDPIGQWEITSPQSPNDSIPHWKPDVPPCPNEPGQNNTSGYEELTNHSRDHCLFYPSV